MRFPVNRRGFCIGLGASTLAGCATGRAQSASDDPLLFAYFGTGKDEASGLKLAVSDDGFTFRALRSGQPFLVPEVGEKKLLRDPFLFRGEGPDSPFHLLWTTAWEGVTIGHATTRDFVNWTPQRAIPVMESVPGTRNCWAPEAIYDPATKRYVIFWSSTVTGRFTETANTSESGYNHRLWYTTTTDFTDFAEPQVLYDPGFSVIDGTFAQAPNGGLWLVVKDETVNPPRKWLRAASAPGPLGPFAPLDQPFTPSWVEGPMTAQIGDALVCYYDVYREGRWGAVMTRDMRTWENLDSRIAMPKGARHGSLMRVRRSLIEGIET